MCYIHVIRPPDKGGVLRPKWDFVNMEAEYWILGLGAGAGCLFKYKPIKTLAKRQNQNVGKLFPDLTG
jgi:hypothetical protein